MVIKMVYYDKGVYVKFNSDVKEQLNKYCKQNKIRMQDLIDDSIREYLTGNGVVFMTPRQRKKEVAIE
jgi:5-formaminoimidazole-4-carboxamide-1-beta-D-ribofuranosyl 5'-monophosphate synthetase